jgi:hypothetical protein
VVPGISRRTFIATTLGGAASLVTSGAGASINPPIGTDSIFRIHPGIGIARLGNADPEQFFIGPEVPGYGPSGDAPGTQVPPYKASGLIKPQAARFRIFRYERIGGLLTPIEEITLDSPYVVSIQWKAHLANKKASFHQFRGPAGESSPYSTTFVSTAPAPLRNAAVTANRAQLLEIDFGERTCSGRSQSPVSFDVASATAGSTWPVKDDGSGPVIDYLGKIRTDFHGRLIVQGGKGRAGYKAAMQPDLPTYANNDGWFDDASDGPVTAMLTIQVPDGHGGLQQVAVAAEGAWVICTPPDFAPGVRPIVTLYDLLTDMAVRAQPVPANALYYGGTLDKIRQLQAAYVNDPNGEFPSYMPSFSEDVSPVLRAAYDMWWVTALVNQKHSSLIDPILADPSPAAAKARQGVFIYLRPPLGQNGPAGPQTMPHLQGDDPYYGQEPDPIRKMTVTHVQYGMFRNWAAGNFTPPPKDAPPVPHSALPPPPYPPPPITPDGLDRAALENCQGGGFYPGIEAGWQIRNPNLFLEPFRIDLNAQSQYLGESQTIGPGHFSRQNALPWQADFNDCRHEGDYGWWPAQRPDDALPTYDAPARLDWARADGGRYPNAQTRTSHADMVANWWKYGFVLYTPDPAGQGTPQFVESERNYPLP